MHKAQVQVDQGPQHKTRYTESNRREIEKEPSNSLAHGEFPEPMAQALGSTIDKRDLMKLRNFCAAKYTVNQKKWQSTEWEKIFVNYTPNRDVLVTILLL